VPSSGCSKTLSAFKTGQNTYNITSSSKSREYIMTIPTSYDATHPYRLVFGMHWMGGSDSDVVSGDYYDLLPLDTGNTSIFVAPEGYVDGSSGTPWSEDDTDQIFFEDMVSLFESSLCIDTTRVFSVGFSFGAMFTNALGRDHQLSNPPPKNILRGVVVYETALVNIYQGTPTGNPMAWWGQVGLSDTTCTPAMGRAARDEWVKNNGCVVPASVPEWTSGNHVCYSYSCPSNYPVRWCTFNGVHTDTNTDNGSSKPWEPAESWTFITQF
jgi:predicted esterase